MLQIASKRSKCSLPACTEAPKLPACAVVGKCRPPRSLSTRAGFCDSWQKWSASSWRAGKGGQGRREILGSWLAGCSGDAHPKSVQVLLASPVSISRE